MELNSQCLQFISDYADKYSRVTGTYNPKAYVDQLMSHPVFSYLSSLSNDINRIIFQLIQSENRLLDETRMRPKYHDYYITLVFLYEKGILEAFANLDPSIYNLNAAYLTRDRKWIHGNRRGFILTLNVPQILSSTYITKIGFEASWHC